jgi:hypothetical protein
VSSNLFDKQAEAGDPPTNNVAGNWTYGSGTFPKETILDLKQNYHLTDIWLFDYNGIGQFKVFSGSAASSWTEIISMSTDSYQVWKRFPVDTISRYVKFQMVDGAANVSEAMLYGVGGGYDSDQNLPVAPIKVEISREGDALRLHSTNNPFATYLLEETFSLSSNSWHPLSSWNSSEPYSTIDLNGVGSSGFYRVRETIP